MDNPRPYRKILRSPSVKRRSKTSPVNQRVQLQRVLGVTVTSNAGLSCDPNTGTIAYPAGCVVVLFNPRRNKQSHIFNTTKKSISCLAFSKDGKYLITGETGHQPAVRVWDVQTKAQVTEFCGHKFGISCVAFSPNMKEVVSVGTQHDMAVCVWNWRTGCKIASNKISSKVSALAFSADGKCFITVGNRHVRFWYLEDKRSKINQTVPLMGRSGILGEQKDNFFCDVVAGSGGMSGKFFVITQSGLLCEFSEKRQLDKWVELRTKTASCITAGHEHIFVGCSEGVVRVFSATSFQYLCSLPKPHHLGVEVTTATSPSHMANKKENAKYPDARAIAFDDDHKKVTCVYTDRSVYVWDVHDVKKAGKAWSFLYHSGCVWDLEMYPQLDDEVKAMLPPGSFLTASSDDTIRVWNLESSLPENTTFKRNIYSNELLKIVYIDPSLTFLCNVDYNPAGATDKTDTTYDGKNGVRSLCVSPDGAELASGDRQGNIRIYDMQCLREKTCVEAHESDVMCLQYSYSSSGRFLATSSRDRLIHVFDVDENYGLVQTLGDHSSSITAVRFRNLNNKLQMISCGADKSILIRNAVPSPEFQFQLEHHLATKITLYDMVIDPTQKVLATACQDRNVRLYNIQTTKEKKCYRGSVGDEGVLLRLHLDPSGSYVATTGTDKNVCILDFHTGELVATMYGHSEVVTGVKFANDLKHLITVSADSCIFVWRLPSEMTKQIKGKLQGLGKAFKETDNIKSDKIMVPDPVMPNNSEVEKIISSAKSEASLNALPEESKVDVAADYRSLDLAVGKLPNWAKVNIDNIPSERCENSPGQRQPKGRWAQRIHHSVEFKSQLDVTSLDDTFTEQGQTVERSCNTLPRIRRKTVVIESHWENKRMKGLVIITCDGRTTTEMLVSLPHIDGDPHDSPVNFSCSLPTTTKLSHVNCIGISQSFDLYKSDTSLEESSNSNQRWSDKFNLLKYNSYDDIEDLDTELDTNEIIYPPNDSDCDQFAGTYKVFAVDDVNQDKTFSVQGIVSCPDGSNKDNILLEDDDDHSSETVFTSCPTSPSEPDKEFLPATPEKEEVARETFMENSFTPVPLDKFSRSVDTMESLNGQIAVSPAGVMFESMPFSPRLSLSARFMSRARISSLKNTFLLQNFSRNTLELIKAGEKPNRNLLAINLNDNFSERRTFETEDLPSPPVKLKEETVSFSSINQAKTAFPAMPLTEMGLNAGTADLMDVLSQQQCDQSMPNTLKDVVLNDSPRRVGKEKERKRIPGQHELYSRISLNDFAAELTTETEPLNLMSTYSSLNKGSTRKDASSEPSTVTPKSLCDLNKIVEKPERLSKTRLGVHPSTAQGLLNVNFSEREEAETPQTLTDFTSLCDLDLLSCLSQRVLDAGSVEGTLENSLRLSSQPRLMAGGEKPTRELSLSLKDKHVSSSVQLVPYLTSHMSSPPRMHPAGTLYQKENDVEEFQSPDFKTPTAEIALVQPCLSSHLPSSQKVHPSVSLFPFEDDDDFQSDFITPTSETPFDQSTLLDRLRGIGSSGDLRDQISIATTLKKMPNQSLENEQIESVAEKAECSVNLLHHQHTKQVCLDCSVKLTDSQLTNPEISPLGLSERDQQNRKPPSSSILLPRENSHHCLPGPVPCCWTTSSHISASLAPAKDSCKYSDTVENHKGEHGGTPHVRDNLTAHHPEIRQSQASMNSEHCHVLPHSCNVGLTCESRSDAGLRSEPSGTKLLPVNFDSCTSGTKYKLGASVGSKSHRESCELSDSSKQTFQLTSSLSESHACLPVSVKHCESVVNDFRSKLYTLQDLFNQVDGRTDETAVQVQTILGGACHEAKTVVMDIITKIPGHFHNEREELASTQPPTGHQDSQEKTFHYPARQSPDEDSTVASCGLSDSEQTISVITTVPDKSAILAATKDMLQPLVSQLSQDLSEGIWKLMSSRVDKMC